MTPLPIIAALLFGSTIAQAQTQPILYLASSSGYMLHRNGNNAVTSDWRGQSQVSGFSGYGPIRVDGLCLTGRKGRQPLSWESCKSGDKSQIWGYNRGRLNNELGWCADVEGNRGGAGVRVFAWNCTGAANQVWRALQPIPLANLLPQIKDASTRKAVETQIKSARPGQPLNLSPAQRQQLPTNLINVGVPMLIGPDGASLISAGGMN